MLSCVCETAFSLIERVNAKILWCSDSRCTYGSCCASCCPAFTSIWPGSGRTASSCFSATAGYYSALNESSLTQRLCACGRPAGHTTRSGAKSKWLLCMHKKVHKLVHRDIWQYSATNTRWFFSGGKHKWIVKTGTTQITVCYTPACHQSLL